MRNFVQARPCPCFLFQDDLLESEPDPELESESEKKTEELAGDLSLSGVVLLEPLLSLFSPVSLLLRDQLWN